MRSTDTPAKELIVSTESSGILNGLEHRLIVHLEQGDTDQFRADAFTIFASRPAVAIRHVHNVACALYGTSGYQPYAIMRDDMIETVGRRDGFYQAMHLADLCLKDAKQHGGGTGQINELFLDLQTRNIAGKFPVLARDLHMATMKTEIFMGRGNGPAYQEAERQFNRLDAAERTGSAALKTQTPYKPVAPRHAKSVP